MINALYVRFILNRFFMLSRRMLRIKVFKTLFGRILSGSDSTAAAEKELLLSCGKTVELYLFILSLPAALKKAAEEKIERGLQKFQPTPEEANPNYKFVENRFISILENDPKFLKFLQQKGLSWSEYPAFVKKLYNTVASQDYFTGYMESGKNSMTEDIALVRNIFERELEDNGELADILEEMSLYWTDDLGYVLGSIIKNMKRIVDDGAVSVPDVFQNEDDESYAKRLLTMSMLKYNEYTELIAKHVPHWDLERLVTSDLMLIVMGITEAVTFETIPLKVTINEYVDISKFYSTPNSRIFVNGLLDKILQELLANGTIVKKGRGLVG